MPLARTHFRNKTKSPAPNAAQFTAASRTPVFLPPSHYAAAAGLDYETIARSRADDISPGQPQQPGDSAFQPSFNPSSPLAYPTQTEVAESQTRASPALHHSGFNRVSRFIARSPSLGKAAAARRATKAEEKAKVEATQRSSRMVDLPLVELQLIPTLRDTIDKMTHPPTPAAIHDEEFDGAIVHAKAHAYTDLDVDHSSASSQASSCSSGVSSMRQSSTRADSLDNYALLQRPNRSSAIYPREEQETRSLHLPPPTKSALRSPSLASRPSAESASVASPRKSRLPAPREALPASSRGGNLPTGTITAESAIAGPSRIPGAPNCRSRFTDNHPFTGPSVTPTQLPLPKTRTKPNFNFGFKPSTPQPPPALRPGYPAFKTPQLAQGSFAQRQRSGLPR
ncbi:hypothetical protein EVJ58_g6946, partial [Rhodofomes roseus]